MQKRLDFSNQKQLELVQPIELWQLKDRIENYCRELCPRTEIALNAYDLIEAELDLERAVGIINENDLKDCEKELTNIIRPSIITVITLCAANREEGLARNYWDNPVENGLLKE